MKLTRAQKVELILQRLETTFAQQQVKATLADYIRLVQLRKELVDEEPREIKVTWMDGGWRRRRSPTQGNRVSAAGIAAAVSRIEGEV